MDNKKAILLVRVSTSIQDYDAQIYDLRNYAESNGFIELKVIETKESGLADLDSKVGTNEMFKFIKHNPEYRTVFTTEISRLGRRQSILHQIKEWFVLNKIQLHIKDLNYSLFENGSVSPAGEMMFTLYGMFAESEIKQRKDRFIRKKKELMENGYSIGGKLLFGYNRKRDLNKRNTLVKNEDEAHVVRTIFNWYLNGLDSTYRNPSIKRITLQCIKLGLHKYTHSKRNVNKLLKEEGYTGFKTTNNKRKNPNFGKNDFEKEYLITQNKIKYPQIIERKIFDQVQTKLKSNILNADKETKHITILSKLINCPSCGRKLSANYRNKNGETKNSYRCTSRTDAIPCDSKLSFSMNLLDSAVWSLIKVDIPALTKKIGELRPNIELLELSRFKQNLLNRIDEVDKEINEVIYTLNNLKHMKNVQVKDFVSQQSKKIDKLDLERNRLENETVSVSNKLIQLENQSNDIQNILTNNLMYIESSKEEVKRYINGFVESIDIYHHDREKTILKIKIIDFTTEGVWSQLKTMYEKLNINLSQYSYLIIDKRVTRQIKLICEALRTAENLEEDSVLINKIMPRIFEEFKTKNYASSKHIPFTKLNFKLPENG
jgi:DNA invertase Pin-like site-specific DNA recombinase